MWTTLLCVYGAGVLSYGMTVPAYVSSHMQQDPWFAYILSILVLMVNLVNSHVLPEWTNNLLSLAALSAWTGIVIFDVSASEHMLFVLVLGLVTLAWIYGSNASMMWLWLFSVFVTGLIWTALYYCNIASNWIAEYMVIWVYGGFWWYWMTYDIRDPLRFYVCAAESGAGNVYSWVGQQA